MADQQSNDTIRQMMSGFSAMQFNLGLLPMAQAQSMGGASQQFQAPPPPPQVPHPGEAAMMAMSRHNDMMQQTLQAAQVTRYQPPPSAPTPSVSAMVGMGVGNPFMAPPVGGGYGGGGGGGGGFGGGGFAGGGAFAGGGFAGGMGGPRLPSVFNPFAPTLPQSHFASPAMRNLQLMQHHQSQMMGAIAGIGEGALGIGGSVLGGAIGGLLGPLGSMAGSYIGGKIGGAVSSMVFNPVTQDFARGRQIQQMTSPFMVSGSSLNTATGQGMDAQSARQVATGVRHLQRDYDFERTGFNTQDTMRIMQSSAANGLLTGGQSPDQLIQKVKEIAKSAKVLMKLTGDPDIQDAIKSLGEMRSMGFNGLAAQTGAVANRATYARMAGVSQAQMGQIMAQGGDMAGQFGLAGATGANAAMFGAGSANVASSSGALNDLQLSRAGGRQGLGQLNTAFALRGMQDEMSLLAGSRVGKGGKLEMDMDAYRRAQGMSFDERALASSRKLQEMRSQGIYDWDTRKQELKDTIAQHLRPGEMEMAALQQARAFQAKVPGMSLGQAIQQTSGGTLDAGQSRALEIQFQSRAYWEGLAQQTRVQKREAQDLERAGRDRYRTPGITTRAGRRIRGALGDISDTLSSHFRAISERMETAREDDDAAEHGEHIVRIADSAIAHDKEERKLMGTALRSRGFRNAYRERGQDPLDVRSGYDNVLFGPLGGQLTGGRMTNRITSMLGLSSQNAANRMVSLASEGEGSTFGMHPFGSFGDVQEATATVADYSGAADMSRRAGSITKQSRAAMTAKLGKGAEVSIINATAKLTERLAQLSAGQTTVGQSIVGGPLGGMLLGKTTSASALKKSDIRQAFVDAHPDDPEGAGRKFDADPSIGADMLANAKAFGTRGAKEVIAKSEAIDEKAGGISRLRSRDGIDSLVKDQRSSGGLRDEDGYVASDKTLGKLGKVFAHNDDDTLAVAAALSATTATDPNERKKGTEALKALQGKLGDKFSDALTAARDLGKSTDADVQEALKHIGTAGTAGGIQSRIASVKSSFGNEKAGAAATALQARLGSYSSKAEGAADSVEAAKGMTEDEIDALEKDNPELAKQVRAIRSAKGEDAQYDAAAQAAELVAPTETKGRYGSKGGTSFDKTIANYEKEAAAAGAAGDEDPTTKMQSESTDLFAKSVSEFATAVKDLKDLKGGGEAANFVANSPLFMSMFGGR